jgi:tetratricopeptide (TPR) repeat protein
MTVIRLTELGRDEDGTFRVRVSFGEEAEYRVTVTDPGDETREKRLAWYFEEHLRYPFLDKDLEQAAVGQIINYGESLFGQVFGGDTSHDYKNLRAHSFDECRIEVSGSATLHRLHWEAMRDPALDSPLAVRMPVTRRVSDQPSKFALPDSRPTLNILIVTARPDGPDDVGYRTISRPLLDALRTAGLPVTIDLVRPGTWDALCSHLQSVTERRGSGWYHVVHFDVHGAFAEQSALEAGRQANRLMLSADALVPFEGRRGFLFFETLRERQADPIPADRVASLLAEHRVPVVVLNACQSAMQSDSEAGLAQRLAQAGVPVAVGMAYSVTVSAAERAMPVLYRRVADGADLTAAVTAARRDLQEHPGRQAYFGEELCLEDWMLPVMFGQRPLRIDLKPMTDQERASFYARQAAVVHEPATEYGFVGRDLDIQVIERRLLTSTDNNELLVQGMAGAGKSTLLRHLAWWWQRTGLVGEVFAFSYEDRAWTSAQIIREVQARLLTKVDQARAETMPEPAQLEQAAHLLRANRHLLILDNAESISATPAAIPHALHADEQDHIKGLLSRLRGGKTLVLIGSREAETWLAPESFGGNRHPLPGLDRQAASTLVHLILDRHSATRWLTDDAERDALDKLVKLLGGYPLPMTVVLPVLAGAAPSTVLADLRTGGSGSDPAGQITRAIEYSHGKLDPGLQASLLLLAPFTAVIPTGPTLGHYRDLLLRDPAVLTNGSIDLAGAVAEVVRVGLATPHPELENYVQVQPVLPYFLRSRLQRPDDLLAAVNQAHYQLYAGLGSSLLDLLISEGDSHRRALGQAGTRAEYANLTAALNHALATDQAINTLIEPLEEYLDQANQQTARRILLDDAITRYPQPATHSQKRQLMSLHNLAGHAAIAQHRLGDAQAHQEIVLQLLEETGDRRQQGFVHHELGRVAQLQRQFEKAEASYRKALDLLLEVGDRRTAAMTFQVLGDVAQAQDRFEEAQASYRKALDLKLEFGDKLSAAQSFQGLGDVAQAQDRFEEAQASYGKALDLKLEFGDLHAAATTYHNLGAAALKQGRLEEAEASYRKALSIYLGPGGDRYRAAATQRSLASLALEQGRLEEAENSYRNALDIFAQHGDQHAAAEIYGELGRLAEKQRQYDKAETSYRQALDIFAQIGDAHSDWDRARDRLLAYYLRMANAADLHLQPLPGKAVPEEFANRASALAWLDARRPRLVAAVAMAADTGRDLIAVLLARTLAGYFDRRRRFDDWLATATNGLEAARRLGDRHNEALALGDVGLALREVRRFDEAITAHTQAAAVFEETRDRHATGVELTTWCAISVGACWPGGLAGGYRSAARSETRPATAR